MKEGTNNNAGKIELTWEKTERARYKYFFWGFIIASNKKLMDKSDIKAMN